MSSIKKYPDATERVVNPVFRELEKQLRTDTSKLARRIVKDKKLVLKDNHTEEDVKKYEEKKGILRKEIENLEFSVAEIKEKKSKTEHYITFGELPEEHKFMQFHGGRKKIIDIIKMISYRAETAMANIILPFLTQFDQDTAKATIKSIFQTPANITPDYDKKILTIELHYLSTHKEDKIIQELIR